MTDFEALCAYANGRDALAFEELVRRYNSMVYTICGSILGNEHDTKDAVQETFLKLARNAHKIKTNVASWLHSCARGTAIDCRRSLKSRERRESQWAFLFSGDQLENWKLLLPIINDCIDELDEADKALMLQYYFRQRTQEDLATEHGVTQQAINKRLQQSVKEVRSLLKKAGVPVSVAVVGSLLSGCAKVQVPAQVMASVSNIGIVGIGASAGSTGALTLLKSKTLAGILAGLLISGLIVTYRHVAKHRLHDISTQVANLSASSVRDHSLVVDALPSIPPSGLSKYRAGFAVSPDGRFSASGTAATIITDLGTGKEAAKVGAWSSRTTFHQFSPSGDRLVVIADTQLALIRTDIWRVVETHSIDPARIGRFVFGAGSVRCLTENELVLLDLGTGREIGRGALEDGVRNAAYSPDGKWICLVKSREIVLRKASDVIDGIDIQVAAKQLKSGDTIAAAFLTNGTLVLGEKRHVVLSIPDLRSVSLGESRPERPTQIQPLGGAFVVVDQAADAYRLKTLAVYGDDGKRLLSRIELDQASRRVCLQPIPESAGFYLGFEVEKSPGVFELRLSQVRLLER